MSQIRATRSRAVVNSSRSFDQFLDFTGAYDQWDKATGNEWKWRRPPGHLPLSFLDQKMSKFEHI